MNLLFRVFFYKYGIALVKYYGLLESETVRKSLALCLRKNCIFIVVELSEINELEQDNFGLFIDFNKSLLEKGGEIVLLYPPKRIALSLFIFGYEKNFNFFKNSIDALESLNLPEKIRLNDKTDSHFYYSN